MDKLAFGAGAADWQERINFDRMRRERLAKARASMKKHGISACLLYRPDNIRYVTAVRGAPEFAPGLRYALAFAEHDPVMYEMGDTLELNRRHCTWIRPENWRFSYSWLGGICGGPAAQETAKKWAQGIYDDLKARGLEREKLGVDAVDDLGKQALAELGIQLTGAAPALREARKIKTSDEIDCMRMAVNISNAGYADLCRELRPGVRECDLGGSAMNAMWRAGAEHANATARSGPNGFEVTHIGNTDRIVEPGDLIYMNVCSTTFVGYRVCVYRSFIVGRRPNAREKDWYRKCHDRVYSVIEAIKPGATTADAVKHFLPASQWGYEADERLIVSEVGHGIGMTYEEPVISRIWSEKYPQPFEPGMVIAVETREGALGYGGVRLEEMVVVTESGHEIISNWPAEEILPIGVYG
jgi:Xaa-Pro aminopeptidase